MAFTPWTAGTRITAAKLAAMTPIYDTWTPTWSTSTGANTPSYGNATVNCSYAQSGDMVVANFEIVMGGTTNFNSGTNADNWRFALPVTAAASTQGIGFMEVNYDGVTAHRMICRARLTSTASFELETSSGEVDGAAVAGSTGLVDAVSPGTWTSGGAIRGILMYPAA